MSAAASSLNFYTPTAPITAPHLALPTPPIQLVLTVTATTNFLSYALTGPSQDAHRWARANKLGPDDGLLEALLEALQMLTAARTKKLLAAHRSYQSAVWFIKNPGCIRPADFKPLPRHLELTIRTGSRNLIEAGTFLRQQRFDKVPTGIESELWCELNRFDVRWTELHHHAAELKALQRWAVLACQPGYAMSRDEETKADYRARVATFEAIDQQIEIEPDSDREDREDRED